MPTPITIYATRDDLAAAGLSSDQIETLDARSTAIIDRAIALRSGLADEYAARFYKLPFTAIGLGLTLAVAQLVAWDLMCGPIGFNADDPANSHWRDRRDEGLNTLERLALHGGPGYVDQTVAEEESAPIIYSEPARGW